MPTAVKCPICQSETPWTGNPYRPFCSERCRFLDLGAWADGKYRIVGDEPQEESQPADETDRQ
jgi:endogenous inhibitor of DNA gyrase (YacG/DUF329 family)